MATLPSTGSWQRFFFVWASLLLVIAALYWTRPVLIPVVLAILITFILSPQVAFLQRHGLGRVLSSLLVVCFAVAVVAGLGLIVYVQVRSLATDLPHHSDEIVQKLVRLQEAHKGSWLDVMNDTLLDISNRLVQFLPHVPAEPVAR